MTNNIYCTTRQEALTLNETFYFTGQPCKQGHIAKRFARSGSCSSCAYSLTVKSSAKRREENRKEHNALRLKYYHKNKTKHPETLRLQRQKYRQANKDRVAFYAASYREHVKRATPGWAERDLIKLLYEECYNLTSQTGVLHHVDHKVPIRGEGVCGLHCLSNLRIISADENILKGNKLLPEFS